MDGSKTSVEESLVPLQGMATVAVVDNKEFVSPEIAADGVRLAIRPHVLYRQLYLQKRFMATGIFASISFDRFLCGDYDDVKVRSQ